MILINSTEVIPSYLTSNVSVTETEWTTGTYNLGDQRYVGTTLYEVVADPSTTDDPTVGVLADPQTWINIGEINRFKMFSEVLSEQTERTGTIEVGITTGSLLNSVAVLNVSGNSVNVVVDDPVEGVVYDTTKTLLDNSDVVDWYTYFFEPITRKTDVVFLDLPAYIAATVEVTVDAGTETAKVGELVVGKRREIGQTNYGTSVGIVDYSKKERDTFGGAIILERAFSKRVEYDISVETSKVSTIANALTEVRAKPTVYIGNEDESSLIVYGYYRDFGITYSTPSLSSCTIEVESLT